MNTFNHAKLVNNRSKAIAIAAGSVIGLFAPPAEAAPVASSHNRVVKKVVTQAVHEISRPQKGDRWPVLSKKMANLVLKANTPVMRVTPKGVVTTRLKADTQVLHAYSPKTDSVDVGCFKLGPYSSYCVDLDAQADHIQSVSNTTGRRTKFDGLDITRKCVTLSLIENSFAFYNDPHDPLTGNIDGQPATPAAQGTA